MVSGLLCLRLVASVELWIEPAGPVLEGSTVTISCRVTGKHPLDIVRLVRLVDDVAYELTTNELLSSTFSDTGRYSIVDYDPDGFVKLQITRKIHAPPTARRCRCCRHLLLLLLLLLLLWRSQHSAWGFSSGLPKATFTHLNR